MTQLVASSQLVSDVRDVDVRVLTWLLINYISG